MFKNSNNTVNDLERYKDAFITYISRELKAAEPIGVYRALSAAGLNDEDICNLGFERLIQKDETALPNVEATFQIDCRYHTTLYGNCVDTSNLNEVLDAARTLFADANIGELEFVSADPVNVQTLDGDFLWETGDSPSRYDKEFAKLFPESVLTEQDQCRFGSWIYTSDRLPDEEEEVIITFDDGTVATSCIVDGDWELWADAPDDVIAWMPMPGAYTADNPCGWTPASKKPSKSGSYLVCTEEGFMASMQYAQKSWKLWDDETAVIAWMELPLPCVF